MERGLCRISQSFTCVQGRHYRSAAAGGFDDLGLQHLSNLSHVHVPIVCSGARAADVKTVEVSVKSMVEAHPNRPTLLMQRVSAERMLQDNDEIAI